MLHLVIFTYGSLSLFFAVQKKIADSQASGHRKGVTLVCIIRWNYWMVPSYARCVPKIHAQLPFQSSCTAVPAHEHERACYITYILIKKAQISEDNRQQFSKVWKVFYWSVNVWPALEHSTAVDKGNVIDAFIGMSFKVKQPHDHLSCQLEKHSYYCILKGRLNCCCDAVI